jgi:hypothetical protein
MSAAAPIGIERMKITIALAMLLSIGAAQAQTACRERPGVRDRHWSWRTIDGRTCWYAGQPGKPKHQLAWPPPDLPPPIEERPHDDADERPSDVDGRATFQQRWP